MPKLVDDRDIPPEAENFRETGARKFPKVPGEKDRDRDGVETAENRSFGLSEPVEEVQEKTRKSEGRNR